MCILAHGLIIFLTWLNRNSVKWWTKPASSNKTVLMLNIFWYLLSILFIHKAADFGQKPGYEVSDTIVNIFKFWEFKNQENFVILMNSLTMQKPTSRKQPATLRALNPLLDLFLFYVYFAARKTFRSYKTGKKSTFCVGSVL